MCTHFLSSQYEFFPTPYHTNLQENERSQDDQNVSVVAVDGLRRTSNIKRELKASSPPSTLSSCIIHCKPLTFLFGLQMLNRFEFCTCVCTFPLILCTSMLRCGSGNKGSFWTEKESVF